MHILIYVKCEMYLTTFQMIFLSYSMETVCTLHFLFCEGYVNMLHCLSVCSILYTMNFDNYLCKYIR